MFTMSTGRTIVRAMTGPVWKLTLAACLAFIPAVSFVRAAPRLAPHPSAPQPAPQTDPQAQREQISEAFSRLPMAFERNEGQTDPNVAYVARGRGYAIYLTPDETVIALSRSSTGATEPADSRRVLRLRLAGSTRSARFFGETPLDQKSNYMAGSDPSRWITDVPTFANVRCEGVYPGIDAVYYGAQGELEYDFVVAPGADPGAIRLDVEGADRTRLDDNGDLVITLGGRELRQRRPSVYQQPAGEARVPVSCRYTVERNGQIGLALGGYDESLPLVVDPVLGYGTYLGGSLLGGVANTNGSAIAIDASGAVYVTGDTPSPNFPLVGSPVIQNEIGGMKDAFVTKLSPTGDTIVYSVFLGGLGDDSGAAIAVDASGTAYLTGSTSSPNFPTANPLFANPDSSGTDAFVAKIAPAGNALLYSTYLGGTSVDTGAAIAVDASGAMYVTGLTASTNFPTMNPLFGDTDGFGNADVFITKIAPTGAALVYSTYLGGTNFDEGRGIAIDATGSAYVTGRTQSTNFPTMNPLFGDTDGFGSGDAFVAKLAPTGSSLVYCTYLGGTGGDDGRAIAIDTAGNAYVVGLTTSTDFPTVTPLFGDTNGFGGGDVFITKLDPAGNALVYSTYLGGVNFDLPSGIVVDSTGAAYVAGVTLSTDFPTMNPLFGDTNGFGSNDAFITKIAPTGSSLVYSTFLGGSFPDNGTGIAIDASGAAYIVGTAASTDFPTVNPLFGDTDGFGGNDVFVSKISPTGNSLVFSTHLDGANDQSISETGLAIAVDASGSAYVTGGTDAIDFPTVNPVFGDMGGNDAFVTKFTPAGDAIVYSTYLGGSATDTGIGIAVDAAGSAYITGTTASTNFPTVNPLFGDTDGFGGNDAFVTKIVPAGNALSYSTYFGGSGLELGFGIALDPAANAYITGVTVSTNLPTLNPLFGDTDGFGGNDAFVARFTPVGTLAYSTYLGGSVFDRADSIAVDAAGNAYIVGSTQSTNFPTLNPLFGDTDGFGAGDAFVTKLTTAGALVYSTYLGGSNSENAVGVAVDGAGSAYVVGITSSTNFPTVNPLFGDTDGFGGADVFVSKLAPTGSTLTYSTYLGGSQPDFAGKIAVDATGAAYIVGQTLSPNFPTVDPLFGDTDGFGGADAFATKLAASGNTLLYSTYLGGSGTDNGLAIAVDAMGNAYLTGQTMSPDFTVASPVDPMLSSNQDAFVAKLVDCTISCPADITVSNDSNQCGAIVSFAATTGGSCGAATCMPASGSFFPIGTTTVSCSTVGGPSCSFTVTVNDTQPPSITCPANIVQNNDTNQCSAVVSYTTPTATDNCPGATVACSPLSGSTFARGTTTVTCTATDAVGAQTSCAFTVTVVDAQAPSITCPANIVQNNDPNQCSAVVSYVTPTATDNCPGVTVVCAPASGSTFAKGTTTVTCTATDTVGNQSSCPFTVTVVDAQAPSIVCPANVLAPATSLQGNTIGAIVNYPSPNVTDNCPGLTKPVCSPASGSFFPMGTTTVTCSVADASGNTASCQFTVTVTSPFDACFVDDATGNTISIVANPSNPLFRLWRLRIAATNAEFTGSAESIVNTAGRSLIAYDHDSPLYRMDMNVNFGTRTCTATVKVLSTGVLYTIRDRDILNDPPCQ